MPRRDPALIRTINELFRACHEDFGLQPSEVLRLAGISSQTDISDPPPVYQQVRAIKTAA